MAFPYQTQTAVLSFADISVQLAHITNLDDLLNDLLDKGHHHEDVKDERLPYWADLWHSAIAMADYLATHAIVTPGMRVTELGCGLGLPGIVAAKMGGNVCMTDYLPEALEFLAQNWSSNLSQPLDAKIMDWRHPDASCAAQLLLASDIVYERRSFEAVISTLQLLTLPGGRIILTEPNRMISKDFLQALEKVPDFALQTHQQPVTWNGQTRVVNILDMRSIQE
ncbi:MAG: hypothetical protein R2795_12200 [Saprospiraceae bacterium]